MNQKKTWTPIEDQIIRKAVEGLGDKPKWKSISQKVNQLSIDHDNSNRRTPKQCRQRWHNKLDPQILDKQWQDDEINKLFELHNEHGNKWSLIATMMNGRTDNCVKNKFYCTLRKGMRKINKFIVNLKRKLAVNKSVCIKEFKDVVLSKLIAVSDKKYDDKLDVKENSKTKTEKITLTIKLALVKVSNNSDDYFGHVLNGIADGLYQVQQSLFKNIQQFCRNCKRKKGKRKDTDEGQDESAMVDQSQLVITQQKIYLNPIKNNEMKNQIHLGKTTQNQAKDKFLIGGTLQDLSQRKNSFTINPAYQKNKAYFQNITLKQIKQEPKLSNEPRFSKIQTQENCQFQEILKEERIEHENPLFFFYNIPSIISNIDFQKTDQKNKLPDNFRVEGIFLEGNLNSNLQNSNNNLSLASSNANFFGQRSGSLGFLSMSRNIQNPFDINHTGNIYTSSSYSSSTNKQQQKFVQIFQNIQKSQKKEQKQTLQRITQNLPVIQSLQLGDLLRRKSQLPNSSF